ncbi:MAG: RsmD family RNA methyltransferase [Opitutaceae bacterium]|jgi:16S rRNA (guanine966-N2)-methyltransferase|nr:RsmD family RNA methyltransferase [Opitutaceae bacterium]
MRITGGIARGIPLVVPKGDAVRPATDGMRQAVFSSLAARVPGAWFLDLCAGSGAYGLEAVSRGAAGGVFVEKNAKAAACLRRNIEAVCKSAAGAGGANPKSQNPNPKTLPGKAGSLAIPDPNPAAARFTIAQTDALTWTPAPGAPPPGLVFIDPPYEIIPEFAPRIFAMLAVHLAPHPDPVIIFEMPGELTLAAPPGWECVKRLGKGARQPTAAFYRKTCLS